MVEVKRNSGKYIALLNLFQSVAIVMLILYLSVFFLLGIQTSQFLNLSPATLTVIRILTGFVVFFSSGLYFIKKRSISLNDLLLKKEKRISKIIILSVASIAIGLAAHLMRSYISHLIQYYGVNLGWREAALATKDIYFAMTFIWVIHSTGEEFFFRGYLYNNLKEYFSVPGAMLISSIIFSLVHIPYSFTHGCFYVFTSLIMTMTYQRFGSLLFPILVHATTNIYSHYCTIQGDSFIYRWIQSFFY